MPRRRSEIYCDILAMGLLNLRRAALEQDHEHCFAEADHLHNIPDLIKRGCPDELHQFYLSTMRPGYARAGRPKWVQTYVTLWLELDTGG
jgi:hypothetical protein